MNWRQQYADKMCTAAFLKDRARQLIAIAAPAFREELQREFQKRFKCE